PDGPARKARGLRAGSRRLGKALARPRGRVPPQGAHVRALLADRAARADAAWARSDVPARDRLASPSALRERPAPPRAARLIDRTRRRPRVPDRARSATAASARRRAGRRNRALLRPRDMGDRRVAHSVSSLRRPGSLGQGRRHAMNRALDVAAAGVGLALTSPVLATAAIAIKLEDGGSVVYRHRRVGVDGVE